MKAEPEIGIYSIKETAGSFTASANRLLADGTDLFSPENRHLLITIDTIIHAEFPALPDNVAQKGSGVPSRLTSFALLVQWMKVRQIHYFCHLSPNDVYQFVIDSAGGLDKLLLGPERMQALLSEIGDFKRDKSLRFTDALTLCGISPAQSSKLPMTKRTFNNFFEGKKSANSKAAHESFQLSISSLWMRARTLVLLWEYRTEIPDALAFEPSSSELARIVKEYGAPAGSTKSMPVEVATSAVSLAFQWVYEYGPALHQVEVKVKNLPSNHHKSKMLREILDQFNELAEQRSWTLRLCTQKRSHLPSNFHSHMVAARTILPAASFVLCAIFTARRIAELLSVHGGSLHGSVDTGFWITTYTGKRATDSPKPCTRSVAYTISQLIEQMKLHEISLDKSVFSVTRNKGRLRAFIARALRDFSSLISYDDEDFTWNLAPHQFRRIFALIYRWRYDHPDLLALSVYFEHTDFKQIYSYTNDPEWRRINQEEALRFTAAKMQSIALGHIEPKGIFGRSLKKLVERELSRIQLTEERGLAGAMEDLAERRHLELKATRWGGCWAKSALSNLKRAACTSSDQVQARATIEPENSSEEVCAGCLFFMTEESRAPHWRAKTASLQQSASAAPPGSMVETRLKQRLHVIERFSRNVFGEVAE